MLVTIYCSGSIQKGTSDGDKKLYWTDAERNVLAEAAHPIGVRFLNPDDPAENLSDSIALFGRDMYHVQFADFVVVDARERRGIGIGIEMAVSKIVGTPLVVVAPKDTYYRRNKLDYRGSKVNNYVHPHLYGLADVIVDNFAIAGTWIKQYVDNPTKLRGTEAIFEAIDSYKRTMLPNDQPTLEVLLELEIVGKEKRQKQV